MSEKVSRIFRRQTSEASKQAIAAIGPNLADLAQDLATSIRNEQITRARVDKLEAFHRMSRWEKLRWLLASVK